MRNYPTITISELSGLTYIPAGYGWERLVLFEDKSFSYLVGDNHHFEWPVTALVLKNWCVVPVDKDA